MNTVSKYFPRTDRTKKHLFKPSPRMILAAKLHYWHTVRTETIKLLSYYNEDVACEDERRELFRVLNNAINQIDALNTLLMKGGD